MKSRLLVSLLAAGSLLLAGPLAAQNAAPAVTFPAASPLGSLKQKVGVTDIEVSYHRPSAKGRQVFGGLVPWGQIWRTGADNATRVTFSTPVKLNGTAVAAGTYELFTIPGANEWTVILQNPGERPQWGAYAYDAKNDAARFTATPVAGPAVETLTFTVGDIRPGSATLTMAWATTQLPVQVEIDTVGMLVPQIEAAMADPEKAKRIYFPSAMFYYENGLDLKKALEWMDAGLAGNPNAFWMIYRKGLILAKAGDKAGAKAAAEQSLAMAEKDQRAGIREEYVRLNQALLESLK